MFKPEKIYKKENIFHNIYKDDAWKKAEYTAVRTTVGGYLYTHHILEVKGADAAAFMDRMFMNPTANLKNGKGRYTPLLTEDAIIYDDCVVFRLNDDHYWISTLYVYKIQPWLESHKMEGEDVTFENITRSLEMFAIQGPRALDLLGSLVEDPIGELKIFNIIDTRIGDIPVKVAKGGFTGEKIGFELYVKKENEEETTELLREKGPQFEAKEVTDVQTMFWTLPVERGFLQMTDLRGTNPCEVGFDQRLKLEREFVGREALLKIIEEGPKRKIMGFTVDDDRAHIMCRSLSGPGEAVILDGEEIGRVTKFTYSYGLDKNCGYALIDIEHAEIGKKVLMNGYEAVLCSTTICP